MKHLLIERIVISTLSTFCWYCTSNSNKGHQDSAIDASIQYGDDSVETQRIKTAKDSLGTMFYNDKPFEILSLRKEVTLRYTGPDDTSKCKDWNLSKNEITSIIKNSEPIDGTYWDLAFAFTTCEINGELKQRGQVFNYSLNGGSWFHITCRDTSMIFGDLKQSHRKYFLKAPQD